MKRLDHVVLTPEVLQAAYAYLATTPPFKGWNLPDSEDVKFVVCRDPSIFGCHWYTGRRGKPIHNISISSRRVAHTWTLMEVMAHEMLHVHQKGTKQDTVGAEHNAAFRRDAEKICAIHGFDWRAFI